MKKFTGKFIFTLLFLTVFAFSCVCASAESEIPTIVVGDVQNGIVEVIADPDDPSKALITLIPNGGYLAAGASLTTENGFCKALEKVDTNYYTCDIPAKECTLNVSFRFARVSLNCTELAMRSGDTFTVTAELICTDDELDTRNKIADRSVIFESSDPSVVSIDPCTGFMTAHKMGYARISASAAAGNGIEGCFYVIVDGDKSPVVGTLQLNAHFEERVLVEAMLPGHSFLIFTNTSGQPIDIKTSNFYQCEIPTEKFYNTVDSYDGTGYDPVTFYYATDGEYQNNDNLAVREAYAEGFFERYERGQLGTYTIRPNDVVTFGNTGDGMGINGGNIEEMLVRYGKSFELEQIKAELFAGTIDPEEYLYRLAELVNELLYDFETGFNPFNGYGGESGGECLNHEMYVQVFSRDYTAAAACKTKITQVQLEAMVDYIQDGSNLFSMLERNCTAVASGAWNLVTAAKPQYHMTPHRGGVTKVLATPLWLRNSILAKGVRLFADPEIEFYDGIDVIKPAKGLGVDCDHQFEAGKCTVCGATDPNYDLKLTLSTYLERFCDSVFKMLGGMFSWIFLG